jgi:hypothetical protein
LQEDVLKEGLGDLLKRRDFEKRTRRRGGVGGGEDPGHHIGEREPGMVSESGRVGCSEEGGEEVHLTGEGRIQMMFERVEALRKVVGVVEVVVLVEGLVDVQTEFGRGEV